MPAHRWNSRTLTSARSICSGLGAVTSDGDIKSVVMGHPPPGSICLWETAEPGPGMVPLVDQAPSPVQARIPSCVGRSAYRCCGVRISSSPSPSGHATPDGFLRISLGINGNGHQSGKGGGGVDGFPVQRG